MFFWGYAGLIENIVNLIKKETGKSFKLVITGGFSYLFKNSIKKPFKINSQKFKHALVCHSCESGNPLFKILTISWIHAFAEMITL